jgi:hypothetical protein
MSKEMKRKKRGTQVTLYVSDTIGVNVEGHKLDLIRKCQKSKYLSLLQGKKVNKFHNVWDFWDFIIQNDYLNPCMKSSKRIR